MTSLSIWKLNWQHDVFDVEFLTKKTKADREYVLKEKDLERKDVVSNMRKRLLRKWINDLRDSNIAMEV